MSRPDSRLPSFRRRRPAGALSAVAVTVVLAILVLGVLELIPANDYMLLPGDARPVEPMITIQGYPRAHFPGGLYMTDVSLYKVNHLLEKVYARLNSDATLEPAVTVSGNLSQKQFDRESSLAMTDSVRQAEAAALNAIPGHRFDCAREGPEITLTLPGTPASSQLRVGDVVRDIDGRPVRCARDVRPLIRRLKVGQVAHVTVLRHGRLVSVAVRTIASTNGVPDKRGRVPLMGIQLADRFPLKLSIDIGNVGGSSAGLMFALGIIERLERRDLTHGCKVAGTGEISFDGQVGAISGAKQKIIAARHVGAGYFLVPNVPDNVRPAEAARGNITVVPVKSLSQALSFLQHLKPCR